MSPASAELTSPSMDDYFGPRELKRRFSFAASGPSYDASSSDDGRDIFSSAKPPSSTVPCPTTPSTLIHPTQSRSVPPPSVICSSGGGVTIAPPSTAGHAHRVKMSPNSVIVNGHQLDVKPLVIKGGPSPSPKGSITNGEPVFRVPTPHTSAPHSTTMGVGAMTSTSTSPACSSTLPSTSAGTGTSNQASGKVAIDPKRFYNPYGYPLNGYTAPNGSPFSPHYPLMPSGYPPHVGAPYPGYSHQLPPHLQRAAVVTSASSSPTLKRSLSSSGVSSPAAPGTPLNLSASPAPSPCDKPSSDRRPPSPKRPASNRPLTNDSLLRPWSPTRTKPRVSPPVPVSRSLSSEDKQRASLLAPVISSSSAALAIHPQFSRSSIFDSVVVSDFLDLLDHQTLRRMAPTVSRPDRPCPWFSRVSPPVPVSRSLSSEDKQRASLLAPVISSSSAALASHPQFSRSSFTVAASSTASLSATSLISSTTRPSVAWPPPSALLPGPHSVAVSGSSALGSSFYPGSSLFYSPMVPRPPFLPPGDAASVYGAAVSRPPTAPDPTTSSAKEFNPFLAAALGHSKTNPLGLTSPRPAATLIPPPPAPLLKDPSKPTAPSVSVGLPFYSGPQSAAVLSAPPARSLPTTASSSSSPKPKPLVASHSSCSLSTHSYPGPQLTTGLFNMSPSSSLARLLRSSRGGGATSSAQSISTNHHNFSISSESPPPLKKRPFPPLNCLANDSTVVRGLPSPPRVSRRSPNAPNRGRWNSMHVRIAYEILHAQKRASQGNRGAPSLPSSVHSKPHLPPPSAPLAPAKRPPTPGQSRMSRTPSSTPSSVSSNVAPPPNHVSASPYRSDLYSKPPTTSPHLGPSSLPPPHALASLPSSAASLYSSRLFPPVLSPSHPAAAAGLNSQAAAAAYLSSFGTNPWSVARSAGLSSAWAHATGSGVYPGSSHPSAAGVKPPDPASQQQSSRDREERDRLKRQLQSQSQPPRREGSRSPHRRSPHHSIRQNGLPSSRQATDLKKDHARHAPSPSSLRAGGSGGSAGPGPPPLPRPPSSSYLSSLGLVQPPPVPSLGSFTASQYSTASAMSSLSSIMSASAASKLSPHPLSSYPSPFFYPSPAALSSVPWPHPALIPPGSVPHPPGIPKP
ncbi:unnamed protein product [Cyprideis torosa]|uniref:Uncharacterized protein n=1 Tax=Cyprideis torosa TaxID=163714 RepID=A0A7R8W6M5_9CRUS|nr:unnamed protein product [Cyprideis torosa]CAG0886658.1 unnamed protein product [Cyprideis torosa]